MQICPFNNLSCKREACAIYVVNPIEPSYSACGFKDIAHSLTRISDILADEKFDREFEEGRIE